jgi:hypothetical protein
MTAARSTSPRFWLGLLLAAALHVAIIWIFGQHKQLPNAAPGETRPTIQWLLPMQQPAQVQPPEPRRSTPRPQPKQQQQQRAAPASSPASAPLPAEPQAITTPADTPDPFALPSPKAPSAGDIMAQARKDLAKIDQDLRKAYPERATAALSDSRQARLDRAFDAAHDAVPPKWYEPAKMAEISPPNARTRMYRITTALLTYCILISEDGRKNYVNCPK